MGDQQKAYSQARYALAAYAKRAGRSESLDIKDDVVVTLHTVSPYTTTIPISSKISPPMYEGAATVKDSEGNLIGTAWVEQMVGAPKSADQ